MVSIRTQLQQHHLETLLQSVDLNIRDLLTSGNDPLPLATYLWCLRRHHLTLITGDALAQWGVAWVRRVLVDHDLGRRKDEELASAALAAIALSGIPEIGDATARINAALFQAVEEELDSGRIPFGRPAYGAILLLAATLFHTSKPQPQIMDAARAVSDAFVAAIPGGRLFGIGFAALLLQELGDNEALSRLQELLKPVASQATTQYEDRIYIAQALWTTDQGVSDEVYSIADGIETSSPAWSYLMVGTESLPSAGAAQDEITISPLYRAMLLDLSACIQANAVNHEELLIDTKYRGDRRIVGSAFALWVILLSVVPAALLAFLIVQSGQMYQYFIVHNYRGMDVPVALGLIGVTWVEIYAILFAVISLYRLKPVMIDRAVQSDYRIRNLLGVSASAALKIWLRVLVVVIGVGLLISFLYPPIQHILGSK